MIKKILLGVVAIVAIILIYAATKPSTYTVVRSADIKARPETVYSFLDNFHKWDVWSPWEKIDPAMKRTYEGAASGKGAVYAWEGNTAVGKGRMEILNVSPPSQVDINLDFFAPMEGHNKVEFALTPQGDTTHITWTMNGENSYLSKLMQVFVSMDSMVGGEFESGLADLKTAAEKAAPTPAAQTASTAPQT
jgi:polyketide cyclase/dehydrase/lipid transport protein